jgi:hypothetical protein
MIICPWCGTSYLDFQSNCKNCGGPLPAVAETTAESVSTESLPTPPPAPRPISEWYIWRLLIADGWAITAFVFVLLGVIFGVVGSGLTIGIITAFVGIPFLLFGIAFLGTGAGLIIWRFQLAQKLVNVLRDGEATRGRVVDLHEDYSVSVNDQHPWGIRYQFQAGGQDYEGQVTTLNRPGPQLQVGKTICVLYLPADAKWNSIYPHP